jgi:hypothetical protein
MSTTITTAAPPTVAEATATMIAWMSAQSGVITDSNVGSQFRTNAEATASVVDMQGTITQAIAFQALVYSAMAAFNIFPLAAASATGTVTFSTGTGGSPPPSVANVTIPSGTVVSTVAGIQYATTSTVVLGIGLTSVSVTASSVLPGADSNTGAGTITQIITGLPYPLFVTNPYPLTNGTDTEPPAQTLGRFTAAVAAIGLSTPVALANACIGVTVSGTGEEVLYSTCYEPWIAMGLSGSASFQMYVDNGSGAASNALLAAVTTVLNGSRLVTPNLNGYRPAGVPFGVFAVNPLGSSVVVSGTAILTSQDTALETAATTAITTYYEALQFGQVAELPQLTAAVANATAFSVTGLQVWLLDHLGNSQEFITPLAYQRIQLTTSLVNFN